MRCPYCGSTSLYYDEYNGMIVCMACGSVIEEGLPDLSGGRRERGEDVTVKREERIIPQPSSTMIRFVDREGRAEDLRVIGRLVEAMGEGFVGELLDVYREVSRLAPKKSVRLRLALAHALAEYRRGRYPLLSVIASRYGVNLESLRRSFRSLLGVIRAVEARA